MTTWKVMPHNTKQIKNRSWVTGIHLENNVQFATICDDSREKADNTARLIAAAPENLAELKIQADQWDDVIEIIQSNPTWDKARLVDWLTKKSIRNARTARAAIAKAEGN